MTIKIDNVSFQYLPPKPILTEIFVSVKRGQFIGIVGPNGGGKTTLAKLINATLIPTTGNVLVDGIDTQVKANGPQIKSLVTYIGADPENQLITSSVYDEIAFSLQAQHFSSNQIKNKTNEAIEQLHLADFVHSHPFHLSMGQRYRVLLAAALARNSEYLVLDEVLSMLDSLSREEIISSLIYLQKTKELGLVLLTHRLEDLLLADKILVLANGTIQFEGNLLELLQRVDFFDKWNIAVPPYMDVYRMLSPNARKEMAALIKMPTMKTSYE